jgi:hypothetical protein
MEINLAGGGDVRFPKALRSRYDHLAFSVFRFCSEHAKAREAVGADARWMSIGDLLADNRPL